MECLEEDVDSALGILPRPPCRYDDGNGELTRWCDIRFRYPCLPQQRANQKRRPDPSLWGNSSNITCLFRTHDIADLVLPCSPYGPGCLYCNVHAHVLSSLAWFPMVKLPTERWGL